MNYNSEIIINRATAEDFPSALKLSQKHSFKNETDKSCGFISAPIKPENLPDLFVAKQHNLFIAKQDEELVGIVIARDFSEKDYEFFDVDKNVKAKMIERLCVASDFRRQGIASQLLNFMRTEFKGITLYAEVFYYPVRNIPSEELLKKHDFTLIGTKSAYIEVCETDATLSLFENLNQSKTFNTPDSQTDCGQLPRTQTDD